MYGLRMAASQARAFLHLSEGAILRVQGPMRVSVSEGQILILGAVYARGSEIRIAKYRTYGLKALVDSKLEIYMEEGASVEAPQRDEEPLDTWIYSVDHDIRKGCRTFVILGPTDSGKSSLASLIANRALLRNLRVGVVDGDVGQADVGPPGCVSAAVISKTVLWLREAVPRYMKFIGDTTPQHRESAVVAAIVELLAKLRLRDNVDVAVVNTDGWVRGEAAIRHKLDVVNYVEPDSVIVLGDERLYRVFEVEFRHLPCGVKLLPSPKIRRQRTREERRLLRSERYRTFLAGSVRRKLNLREIAVQNSCLLGGLQLDRAVVEKLSRILGVDVLHAVDSGDVVRIAVSSDVDASRLDAAEAVVGKKVEIVDVRDAKNLIVGVIGHEGQLCGIGVIRHVDLRTLTIEVETPCSEEIRGVVLGRIKISENMDAEYGRVKHCVL